MASSYKYAVRLRGKVVAYTTTKREAEQEARAVGGAYGPIESVPAQYVEGFEGKAFGRRVAEIQREREIGSYQPLPSDEGVVTQRSKWSEKFEKAFGRKPYDVRDVSNLTGIPQRVLQEVYDRGLAAWSTGGHRPGASQHGWAMARVQSFVLGGPTSRGPDRDLAAKANPAFAEVYGKGAYAEVPKKVLQQDSDLAEEAFDLIDRAYAPIGGHAGMRDVPSMLADDADLYVMEDIDEDPQADVLQVYKTTPFGRKAVAVGQDGTKAARRRAVSLKIEDFDRPGYYGEVSGRIAEILLDAGAPVVNDPEVVRMVLRKPIEWLNNGGWYKRMLGGHMHEKILVGRPLIPNPRDASTRFRTLDQTGLGLVLYRKRAMAMLMLVDADGRMGPRDGTVVGMLMLDKHEDRCWGAWEVVASAVAEQYAGKGLGMAMYLAALALLDAPIVSDRHSVSPAARKVWNRIYEDTDDFRRKPLDNILMPKTPPRVDDCLVHNDPALDHAYKLSPEVRDAILPTIRKLSRRGLAIAEEQAQASRLSGETPEGLIEGRWARQATALFEEALTNRSSPLVDLEVSEEDLSELRRLLRL